MERQRPRDHVRGVILSGSGLLVPQLAGVVVERVERLADRVLITATAAGERGSCPGCGTNSVRVHSRYQRRVADAPIVGASVVIGVRGRAVLLRLFGLPEADLRRAGPWLDRGMPVAALVSGGCSRRSGGSGRVRRPAAIAVLAGRAAGQAHLPDAQLGDVRLRPSHDRRRGGGAQRPPGSRLAARSRTGAR
jgi:hypothetical protein